jgi:uncharacterized membrane protein
MHDSVRSTIFRLGSFSKGRLEAFSDGVFAIVVTLLVLELRVPQITVPQSVDELAAALLALLPKLISWIISFAVTCVIWLNHHRLLDTFRGINHGLFWMNALLLLWVSFVPFPTALLGDYPANPLAVSFYGVALSLMGLSFVAMRWYVLTHAELLKDEVDRRAFRASTRLSFIFGAALYLIAALLAWVQPVFAFAIYLFIPIYFIFPRAMQRT